MIQRPVVRSERLPSRLLLLTIAGALVSGWLIPKNPEVVWLILGGLLLAIIMSNLFAGLILLIVGFMITAAVTGELNVQKLAFAGIQVAFVFVWAFLKLAKSRSFKLPRSYLTPSLVAFAIIIVFSLVTRGIYNVPLDNWLRDVGRYANYLLFFLVVDVLKTKRQIVFLRQVLLFSMILVSVSGIAVREFRGGLVWDFPRLPLSATAGGSLLAFFACLGIVTARWSKGSTRVNLNVIMNAMVILALALGALAWGYRAGWISLLVGAGIYSVLALKRDRAISMRLIVLLGFVAIAILFLAKSSLLDLSPIYLRFSQLSDSNGNFAYHSLERAGLDTKIAEIRAVLSGIRQSPLFGFGFGKEMEKYMLGYGRVSYLFHTTYAGVLWKTGIFGLIVFTWMLVSVFRDLWQIWHRSEKEAGWLSLGLLAGLLAAALFSFTEHTLDDRVFSFFFSIWLGLVYRIHQQEIQTSYAQSGARGVKG